MPTARQPLWAAGISRWRLFIVITSYSIHYTKLYEPKVPKKLPRSLNAEDIFKALATLGELYDDAWQGKRDRALILLLYGCGLRISEALGLKGGDIVSGGTLRILGKGGKERIVPMLQIIKEAVDDYKDYCPYEIKDNANLFLGARGGDLNPGVVQRQVRKIRALLSLPERNNFV